jgi:hypothetical protein
MFALVLTGSLVAAGQDLLFYNCLIDESDFEF